MSSENKRIFLTVVLSGIVLFGWQYFFAPKKELTNNTQYSTTSVGNETTGNLSAENNSNVIQGETKKGANKPSNTITDSKEASVFKLERLGNSFSINNRMEVVDAVNVNQKFDFKSVVGKKYPFKIFVNGPEGKEQLFFDFENSTGASKLKGYNSKYDVNVNFFLEDSGQLKYSLISTRPLKFSLVFESSKKELSNGQIRQFLLLSKDVERVNVNDEENIEANVKWMGIDFNYHLFAAVLDKKYPVKYIIQGEKLSVDILEESANLSGSFVFLKKNYDDLIALGNNLDLAVDFGIFSILAVPTLRALQYIYNVIPNYGWAIIILTLLMRLVTYPLQFKSFKSMKRMQTLQPELQKIKEKFKDDPQRVQRETMELFKRTGVNPLGGCLPLLIQMPIFFAFYRVLYGAVELVEAPFHFWITDLSLKDPYYVLPIAFCLSMLLSTKITPSTSADPNQKKIMYLMPIVFGFIMKDLPAGLCLYMFVSTIFGIAQQLFVYRIVK